jgi:hypothetical protein
MQLIKPNDNKLFALIYGMSGTGKTHLAATYALWHPDDNILLIDADQGSKTLLAPEFEDANNIFVVDFREFAELDEIYQLCEKNTVEGWIKKLPALKDTLKKPFKCIVWDTWSECQWIFMDELRKKNGLRGKGLNFRTNIQLQHWGQMTDLNKMSVIAFKELPIDCLFLMQSEVSTDAITQQVIKGPAIHGKLTTELPAMFNTVIYTYTTPKGEWAATTLPKLGWPAKVRGTEGKDLILPTMEGLLDD